MLEGHRPPQEQRGAEVDFPEDPTNSGTSAPRGVAPQSFDRLRLAVLVQQPGPPEFLGSACSRFECYTGTVARRTIALRLHGRCTCRVDECWTW